MSDPVVDLDGDGDPRVEAVAEAYVWGYPLVVMHRTCAGQGGAGAPPILLEDLATAANRAVVAPNNDTLYSSAWYDLRRGDVTVDVGVLDPPDRYWSVMILDAYTNVRYVCRRLHGTGGATVRVTYDPELTTAPAADSPTDVVAVGTPTVWLLARVVVDGPEDLAAARAAQSRVRHTQDVGPTAAGSAASSRADRPPSGTGFLAELRTALQIDPPAAWHPAPPAGLDLLLDDVATGALPDDVVAAGLAAGERQISSGLRLDRFGNGWGTRSRGALFGDDVTYRAAFAKFSLAGHLPAENRSYSRMFDGTAPAILRFPPGGEPPVDGLWSLCLYGPDLFLVANPIDRYSIGDRTPGLVRDPDGGLSILIAAPDPADPARPLGADAFAAALAVAVAEVVAGAGPSDADNAEALRPTGPTDPSSVAAAGPGDVAGPGDAPEPGLSSDPIVLPGAAAAGGDDPAVTNWLPAPAGPCFLALRAYEGRAPVVAADWFPPDLVPVR
jgi:hypothetical protein